ncbi:MAG: hypothetical protein PF483_06465 [Halothiobacillus sp.]|jgi:hypothetical protein|nr:hypothetical protein [Halothiobacillus sp.]
MTVRSAMSDFWEGFRSNLIPSLRSAPREFFAPLITLARWMGRVSQEGASPPQSTFTLSSPAKECLLAASGRLGMSPELALELAIHQLRSRTARNPKIRDHPSAPNTQRPVTSPRVER